MAVKRLILMRHGHSPAAGAGGDAARPLSARGKNAALLAAKKLSAKGFAPELALSSPLVRAMSTAETAAAHFGARVEVADWLDGSRSCSDVWEMLLPRLADCGTVMAVGHQPGLGMLAGALMGGCAFPFQPAGVCVLRFDGELPPRPRACAAEEFSFLDPEV
ncbi:MAG: histidine phosphatase family protein [Elusimicrobiales bacterium]